MTSSSDEYDSDLNTFQTATSDFFDVIQNDRHENESDQDVTLQLLDDDDDDDVSENSEYVETAEYDDYEYSEASVSDDGSDTGDHTEDTTASNQSTISNSNVIDDGAALQSLLEDQESFIDPVAIRARLMRARE